MSERGKSCPPEGLLLRALDEELAPREAWLVKLHLESCEACQVRLEGPRRVSSQVVALHQVALPQQATARFVARLEEEESREQRNAARRWFGRPLWRLAWCGALAVLLLAGLMLRTPRTGSPARHIVPPPSTVPALVPKQFVAAAPDKPARPVHHHARSQVAQARSGGVAAREVVTPFFTLPFSDAALPLDQATVIRVDLPRSALELAGLPVDEERRNGRIRADLVLGADGLARAIRFVE